jgi:hypothetical protein
METQVIQWLMQQTGMAGIAALSLFMLNKVWEQRIAEEKKRTGEINQMREQLLEALKNNTEVMTRLMERLDIKSSK